MSWTTKFSFNNRVMIHTLSDRVKVFTNFDNKTIRVLKDGIRMEEHSTDDFDIEQYTLFLIKRKSGAMMLELLEERATIE